MRSRMTKHVAIRGITVMLLSAAPALPVTAQAQTHIDHYVPVTSTAPGYAGLVSNIYVREIEPQQTGSGDVVLFVHGAGTPAEVAFDVPVAGYSWMRYLADRGLHVYSMDMTGYGRSTRPPALNDRCNLPEDQQRELFGNACPATEDHAVTTIASDWADIDAVVDYLRDKDGKDRVHLIGWSQGGPRTGGYAARHPGKVASIVQLAPAYSRTMPAEPSEQILSGLPLTKQTRKDFIENWDRQVGCERQYDPAVAEVIFDEMLASDPVGATWGPGLRRAPRVPSFGWTPSVVGAMRTPLLMVTGTHDGQVNPEQVKMLYEDLGSQNKVLIEMHCASHNAMWEKDAAALFDASYQWISKGTYNGQKQGRFDVP
jgi:pimeloyl-ACP methyl ester carboxylesterase